MVQQVLKGSPWPKSFSIALHIRHARATLSEVFIDQLLVLACGEERGCSDGSISCVWLQYHPASMAACFSSQGIPCSYLLLHSPSGCLPAINSSPHLGIPLQDPCSCLGYVGLWYKLSVWLAFHSDHHRSTASCSNNLKCLPSVPDYWSDVGISPLLQFLCPRSCRSSPTHSPFPLLSSILVRFAWTCIFLSSGHGLLQSLSWCSVRSSASEYVFLMHLWREKYSTSTYSSAILSFHLCFLIRCLGLS